MEENESRNCNQCGMCSLPNECACVCKYNFQLCEMEENNELPSREELGKKLSCYKFAIIELGLYLDTHPDDKKVIALHNDYAKQYKKLSELYQRLYGPLTIMYPCKKWRWLEQPWPWEGGCR